MAVKIVSSDGNIHINDHVIADIAGSAAMECYGLVGMASRKHLKDSLAELMKKENLRRGIVVRQKDDGIHVDLHMIVSYGTKISEVAHNVQTKVTYVLQEILGLKIGGIHVIVQGVRVTEPQGGGSKG